MGAGRRPADADVVVIGAGVTGASIGFQLARHSRRRVVIVDARAPVGGISGRTFGQIRQHYSNELMVRMAMRGFHCIRDWGREVGYGDPGYVRLGYLLLVVEDQLDGLRRNIGIGAAAGVNTRFVGPGAIAGIEPLLRTDDLAGGAYEPDGGYIDVTKMVLSWLGAASSAGASVVAPASVAQITASDGAVTGVALADGSEIRAPVVVAATGAWARDLLDPLGVSVPVQRRRLDMAMRRQRPGTAQLHCCVTDGNSNLVIRPDMGRHVLAVAYPPGMPEVDDPLAEGSAADHRRHAQRIDRALRQRLPTMALHREPVALTSGAYDITPDYHPILGWADEISGVAGLYLAVGFSGHGLKLSPAVGEIAAADVLGRAQVGGAPPLDARALRPGRFADGELMHLTYGPSARA